MFSMFLAFVVQFWAPVLAPDHTILTDNLRVFGGDAREAEVNPFPDPKLTVVSERSSDEERPVREGECRREMSGKAADSSCVTFSQNGAAIFRDQTIEEIFRGQRSVAPPERNRVESGGKPPSILAMQGNSVHGVLGDDRFNPGQKDYGLLSSGTHFDSVFCGIGGCDSGPSRGDGGYKRQAELERIEQGPRVSACQGLFSRLRSAPLLAQIGLFMVLSVSVGRRSGSSPGIAL
jgi:hypothetical protein